jgi:hypothetical protein
LLPKITVAAVAAVAALAFTQSNAAAANLAQTTHGSLSRTAHPAGIAAAPPEGCQRQEAYGTPGWWSAVQGCLTNQDGRSVVKIESDCQYKSLVTYSHVACNVRGRYAVSKDGEVLQSGTFGYTTDPFHGGGTVYYQAYTCAGTGTYTLKLTDIKTVESRPGYFPRGDGSVPDITAVAMGC